MSREIFTLEKAETRMTKKGKEYRLVWRAGQGTAFVWNEGDHDFVDENKGQIVSAEIEKDGEFTVAKAFQRATDAPASPSQAAGRVEHLGGGSGMSKAEWQVKDDKQRVGILYSVHLKLLHEYYLAHPEDPEALTITSYKDIVARARRAAVEDLGWINGYATGEVPFG